MRKISVMVLFAIIISLATPLFAITSAVSSEGTIVVLTLDVCGSSGHTSSTNHDMPSVCECPCKIVPLTFISFLTISKPLFSPLLIPSQEERPPKV
jgi:hypothetical protein